MDHGVIVIGGGHNGLICASYLARAGLDVVVLEARDTVGGCASTVDAIGARVNICNCDHIVVRSTPIAEELDLERHGLRYLDLEPAQLHAHWDGSPAWAVFHDVDQTLSLLRRTHPDEVEGYRRYVAAAKPVAELIVEMANHPPSVGGVLSRVAGRRAKGVSALMRFSRMSAADVLRSFFSAEAMMGPSLVTGPAVWGLSPTTPGTGLGATNYALKHVVRAGRPVGGSGALPDAVLASFLAAGGTVRTASAVAAIVCDGDRVRGVELEDGTTVEAPIVVSAIDPHSTFVRFLRNPPSGAGSLVDRWRAAPRHEGYESKIDAVVAAPPQLPSVDASVLADHGVSDAAIPTAIVSPSIDDMARAHLLMQHGKVAERPMFFANTPSALDPAMRSSDGQHVFSLEVLYTPYSLDGGWAESPEPWRWLESFASFAAPGFLDGVQRWRVVTPAEYERDFHMPRGYATSFSGGPLAALMGKDRELTRYETPVRGLYLTGAATFPGAGVWGASGRNTATVILRG